MSDPTPFSPSAQPSDGPAGGPLTGVGSGSRADSVPTERLADYLDAGREPYDPLIEDDPECLAQLLALERLRALSSELVESDVATAPAPDPSWIASVMDRVRLESRTGRDIPLASPDVRSTLHITEGAVRSLVREAGDVGVVDAPIRVDVAVSVVYGADLRRVAELVREAVSEALARQTEIVVESLDVTVRDVHLEAREAGL